MDKKETIERAVEIFRLALEANGAEERKQSRTGYLPTVFCWYSGHTNTLLTEVHNVGWAPDRSPDFSKSIYLDRGITDEDLQTVMGAITKAGKAEIIDSYKKAIDDSESKILHEKEHLLELKRNLEKALREGN